MRKMKLSAAFCGPIRWLKKAVRALPRCKEPVGLGANRVTTGDSLIEDISQDCTYSSRISEYETTFTDCLDCSAVCLPAVASRPKSRPMPKRRRPAPAASPQVQVVTSMGNFTIELNAERAPLTVAHFLDYVDQGHYTNTIFHRVVANFVIQGGGFDADYKPRPAAAKVVNESGNGLSNVRGTVGLARTQRSAWRQRSILREPARQRRRSIPMQTRWGYAVFGKVVQGMEVVDRSAMLPPARTAHSKRKRR